jgi:tRNA nucleotidyltransferase (CCA-adding enzyme)
MPDYIFMLESRLSPEQLQVLNRVQQEAQDLGLNLYLVGGAVRDLMSGSPIRDLDFATEGNPLRLARRLEGKEMRRLEIDTSFRSAELVMPDGVSLSLEMARSEAYTAPHKPPQVAPAPIMEDLRRRDFSVNAMGISLTPGSRGLLLDPTNGLADIERRELRILHNYSFVHDPLRLLRLVRFAARLGFRPEARSRELFEAALERGYQRYIQPGPLGREVEQIAREANVAAVLKSLNEYNLLAVLHPLLPKRKPDYDGLAKLQRYREQAEQSGYRPDLFVAVLHYLSRRLKGRARTQLLRNLGQEKATVKQVLGLEKEARKVVKLLSRRRRMAPREIYYLLTPIPVDLLVFVLAEYSSKQKVQAKIYNYLFKYRPLRNRLPVRELQLMGVPTGPKFDQILQKYFEAQLDGKLRGRAQQLRFLRKLAGVPKPVPKVSRKEKAKKAKPSAAGEAKPAETHAARPAAGPAAPAKAVETGTKKPPGPKLTGKTGARKVRRQPKRTETKSPRQKRGKRAPRTTGKKAGKKQKKRPRR